MYLMLNMDTIIIIWYKYKCRFVSYQIRPTWGSKRSQNHEKIEANQNVKTPKGFTDCRENKKVLP